jgi:hypothetical protein
MKKDKQILKLILDILNLIYIHGHFLGEKDYKDLANKILKLSNLSKRKESR